MNPTNNTLLIKYDNNNSCRQLNLLRNIAFNMAVMTCMILHARVKTISQMYRRVWYQKKGFTLHIPKIDNIYGNVQFSNTRCIISIKGLK